MADLVPFPGKARPVNDGVLERLDFAGTAKIIARLALMDAVGYERARIAKAKEIGCRASFLDKIVSAIRMDIRKFEGAFDKAVRCEEVRSVELREDGRSTPTWTLAVSENDAKHRCLVLLADGSLQIKVGSRDKRPC